MTTNRFWIHKPDERSQQVTTFGGCADAQDQANAYARQGWTIEWVK
jgi:hypothetical protein